MALSVKVDAVAQPSETGVQTITVGFEPKVVFVWGSQLRDTTSAHAVLCFGAATSSTNRAVVGMFSVDALSNADAQRISLNSVAYGFPGTTTDTYTSRADFDSFTSTEFKLEWVDLPDENDDINYLALGGSDLTDVTVLEFTSKTTIGTQPVTGAGFQPDAIILFTSGSSGNWSAWSIMGLGFGVSASEQASAGICDVDAASTMDTGRWQHTGRVVSAPTNSQNKLLEADLVTLDADGFTLNWDTVNLTARRVYAICLKGGQYAVGSDTQKTSTGTKATTGVGFTPSGLLFASRGLTSASTVATQSSLSVGAATSGSANSVASASSSQDNASTSNTNRSMNDGKCIDIRDPDDNSLISEAHVDSLDADGFTLDWTTADVTAREFIFLAFGDDAAVGTVAPLLEGGMLKGGFQTLGGGM